MPLSHTFALKNFILRERDSSKPRKQHQSMASSMIKSLIIRGASSPSISPASSQLKSIICSSSRSYAKASAKEIKEKQKEIEKEKEKPTEDRVITSEVEAEDSDVPTSGISRPLSEILRELNKRVPDALIRVRNEDGFSAKYVPWHVVNRIMNIHAPEWSGEIRSITYSADGKSVSVVYRVTLYGTDAEIYRESSGTASLNDTSYGDPVQKAEAMAFRRACARLGLGLHLYHEDML